jgi:hypothetical protein
LAVIPDGTATGRLPMRDMTAFRFSSFLAA